MYTYVEKKVMKMKRFNEEVYTGSPKVNLIEENH